MFDEHEDKNNPGKATLAMLQKQSGNIPLSLVSDVIEHMRRQNEQQKENNQSQRETNTRVAFVSKAMVLGCAFGVFLLVDGIVVQYQTSTAVKRLERLEKGYESLNASMTSLRDDVSTRLKTTPGDIAKQITTLEKKVDDTPKITANEKTGKLQLEVPVATASASAVPPASAHAHPPPAKASAEPPRATIVLSAPQQVELR